MSESLLQNEEQKKTKKYVQNATIIYSLLLPFLLWFAGLFGMVAGTVPTAIAIVFVGLWLCVPLSIPFTLFFVWSQYRKKIIDIVATLVSSHYTF